MPQAGVEPSVADGAGVKMRSLSDGVTTTPADHGAEKQCPTNTEQHDGAMIAEKVQAFAHLAPEALELAFGGDQICAYPSGRNTTWRPLRTPR